VDGQNAARAAGLRHAAGGSPISVLGSTRYQDTALSVADQGSSADPRSASAEAISAARDLAFEALVETASLGESYARSLSEAAWRGDRTTVELHIRQWRSCLLAAIDAFKQLDVVEARGGGS
jgi:hypothetical protein